MERSNIDHPVPYPRDLPHQGHLKGLCSPASPASHSLPVAHPPGWENKMAPCTKASSLFPVMQRGRGEEGTRGMGQ